MTARGLPPVACCVLTLLVTTVSPAQQTSPGAGPVIVLETARGAIEFETYPDEAPKTVAHVIALVEKHFYDGLRFHRAEPDFLVQVGDPETRDLSRQGYWGTGASGTPIGVAEITKKRQNVRGAVGITYAGSNPRNADSQFYILLEAHPELNARYAIFGQVISGMDVVDRIERGDVLKRAYLKTGG
jgi:cyclophilin family peptidyl-prolyl cis-trans isomerase